MSELTSEFNAHARSIHCDLLGVAPIDRFEDVEKEHHPASIFPETRSVIVVGKRIPRGALRGVEEGTQFHIYKIYGQQWVQDRILALTTQHLCEFLEDRRWESVPLLNLPPEMGPLASILRLLAHRVKSSRNLYCDRDLLA